MRSSLSADDARAAAAPTVLMVDDDENALHGLVRALCRQPYRVYTARSGVEALWILKSRHVDVIVSDERMPGLSGTQLLRWVARNLPDVGRILLTGYPSVGLAVHTIKHRGIYRLLTKPCPDADLCRAIRQGIGLQDET